MAFHILEDQKGTYHECCLLPMYASHKSNWEYAKRVFDNLF